MSLSTEQALACKIHDATCCTCSSGAHRKCPFLRQPKKADQWFFNKANLYYLQLARAGVKCLKQFGTSEEEFIGYCRHYKRGYRGKNPIPNNVLEVMKRYC